MKTFVKIITIVALSLANAPASDAGLEPPSLSAELQPAGIIPPESRARDPFQQEPFGDVVHPFAEAMAVVDSFDATMGGRRVAGGSGKALVILSGEGVPEKQANLEEDLAVMTRVLDKVVEGAIGGSRRPVMGINVLFSPDGGRRSLYLDGYGALFLMRVNFPLLGPPRKTEEPREKPAADSTWDEARRELYGQPGERKVIAAGAQYDAGKVDRLKDAVLEALKSAANIRHLAPDEYVTISIFGDGGVGELRTSSTAIQKPRAGTARMVSITQERGTMMTIRAKRSEIDAFAKGRLTLEEFRKKVTIAACHGGFEAAATNEFRGFGGARGGTFGGPGFGAGSGGFDIAEFFGKAMRRKAGDIRQ